MAITFNSGENRIYVDNGTFTWANVKSEDDLNAWGVISELGTHLSHCTAIVRVANGATTVLECEHEAIQFDQPIEVANLGTFRAGGLLDDLPIEGCTLVLNMNATYGIEPLGGTQCAIELRNTRIVVSHATATCHVGHPTNQFQSDYRRVTMHRVDDDNALSRMYVGENPTVSDVMASHQEHGLNVQQSVGTPGEIDTFILHHLAVGILVNGQTFEAKGVETDANTTDVRVEGSGTLRLADSAINQALIDHAAAGDTTDIQNTVNLTVQDDLEVNLQNARVTVFNGAGEEQGSELTAADGTHAEIRATHTRFTGSGKPPSTTTDLQPIRIRAYFYPRTPFSFTTNLTDRVEQTIALLTDPFVVQTTKATVLARTGITVDEVAQTITIGENHTLQDIYEYCLAYVEDNPDDVDAPITTSNGVIFECFYDFIINDTFTVTATGKELICQAGKTYTINGSGEFDGIVADQSKRRVPVIVDGVIVGSRVFVKRDFDNQVVIQEVAGASQVKDFFEWIEP